MGGIKDDREMHVKAQDDAAAKAQEALRQRSEENAKAALETPQNPVKVQIEIIIMMDGTFHMNGPWHDRFLFEGVMSVAKREMQDHFKKMAVEQAKRNQPRVEAVTGVPDAVVNKLRQRGA
jgi:hypothetical protein